jgi:hypothetical protein
MCFRFSCSLLIVALSLWSPAWDRGSKLLAAPQNPGGSPNSVPPLKKVPTDVILVKGAWSSASDSLIPVPEGGNAANGVFSDPYFGMTYALPSDWTEKYKGPPPSDSGRYVLAQLGPRDTSKGPARGNILITAQDMFFTPTPASNAAELVNYMKENLQPYYKVETPPTQIKIADRSFTFFAYWSPVAQLHWCVLATQVRCHTLQIVLTSRDTKLLEGLILDMNKMKLPVEADLAGGAGGGPVPVCVKNYARDENIIARVNPVFTEHRFNPVPVRIIIDKEGKIKHIHFLSAFPDQAEAISDALDQWKFKPFRRDGRPVEVETGILFGRAPRTNVTRATGAGLSYHSALDGE